MSFETLLMDMVSGLKTAAEIYVPSALVVNGLGEGLKRKYGYHKRKPKRLKEVPFSYKITSPLQKLVNLPLKAGYYGIASYWEKPKRRKEKEKLRRRRKATTAVTLTLAGMLAFNAYLTKDIEKVADHFTEIPQAEFLYLNPEYGKDKQIKINLDGKTKNNKTLDVICLNTAQKEAYFTNNGTFVGMTKMGIGPKNQPSMPFAQKDFYNTNGDFGNKKIPYDDGYFTHLKVAAEIKRNTKNPYYQVWMGEKAILLAERYWGFDKQARGLWLKIGPTIHGEYTGFFDSLFQGHFHDAGKIALRTVERNLFSLVDDTNLNPTAGCVRFPNEVLRSLNIGEKTKVFASYDMDMFLLDKKGNLYVIANHTNPYDDKVSEEEGYQQFLHDLRALNGRAYYGPQGKIVLRPDFKKINPAFYHGLEKGVYRIPMKPSS